RGWGGCPRLVGGCGHCCSSWSVDTFSNLIPKTYRHGVTDLPRITIFREIYRGLTEGWSWGERLPPTPPLRGGVPFPQTYGLGDEGKGWSWGERLPPTPRRSRGVPFPQTYGLGDEGWVGSPSSGPSGPEDEAGGSPSPKTAS